MNMMEIINQILVTDGGITTPVYAGTAAGNTQVRNGLITYFQLPGTGPDFKSAVSYDLYQIDIWHEDIYEVESIKEQILSILIGWSGNIDGKNMIINIENDNGMLYEDSDQIYHASITIAVKYARRFA